jgi:multiple sugar transport system ATP-binding protein
MADIVFDHVSKRYPDGTLAVDDLDIAIADHEFMIFVGPSGCGKTTALRMVAGLEDVTSGQIRLGGAPINDVDASERDIAMVFQSYALYPHMSAQDNLSFPLRMRGMTKTAVRARVREVASLLGIEDLLTKKPRELSGGQRQRVAMGRAIIRHPKAFLMDEPLSNLDAKLRVQMRAELVKLHRNLGVTTIYVTHDQTEAMTLGQRVTVLDRGVVQQVADPHELYLHPANTFVASFIGSPPMNFLKGRLENGGIDLGAAFVPLAPRTAGRLRNGRRDVTLGLRPEGFVAAPDRHASAERDETLRGEVDFVEQLGAEAFVYFRAPGVEVLETADRPIELAGALCARLDPRLRLDPGDPVVVAVEPDHARLFDPQTGVALTPGGAVSDPDLHGQPAVDRQARAGDEGGGVGGEEGDAAGDFLGSADAPERM